MEKLLSLPSRTAQRSLPCSVRQTGGTCWDTGRWHQPPAPAAGRAGAGKADPAGSWHRDSPLPPPWGRGTFGMGRIFSLFPQLSNSLSAVSSRGESQRSQPQFPPSLPASGSSFWDLSGMAGGDPAPRPRAGTSSSCSAGNAQFHPRATPAALPGQPEQRSGISFSRDNGNWCRVCRTSEEAGAQ